MLVFCITSWWNSSVKSTKEHPCSRQFTSNQPRRLLLFHQLEARGYVLWLHFTMMKEQSIMKTFVKLMSRLRAFRTCDARLKQITRSIVLKYVLIERHTFGKPLLISLNMCLESMDNCTLKHNKTFWRNLKID